MATTAGNLNTPVIFSTCFNKFGRPASKASKLVSFKLALSTPPLYFNALTVTTIITASGFISAILHFISKNFSAPKSAPNPPSVTT